MMSFSESGKTGSMVPVAARRFLTSPAGTMLLAGILSFAVALFRGPAMGFVFDARHYWDGAQAVLSGGNFYKDAGLAIRGVFATVVYIPAALAAAVFGRATAGMAVLIQNSLLLATMAAVVVPKLVRLVVPTSARHVWASAILTTGLLSGFVPYPLLDLWALALLFLGIWFVFMRGWIPLVLGGFALGVAVNLRPAYLVPILLGCLTWVAFNWSRAWLPALGVGLAFVPQLLTTKIFAGAWRPWPIDTFLITNIQAQYASFTVRYDTVAFSGSRDPRQFFCSPDLAAAMSGDIPRNSSDLAFAFAKHLPQSIAFISQKVAASLQWSWATPYASSDDSLSLSVMAVLVTLVAAIGFGTLLRSLVQRRRAKLDPLVLTLLAIWLGSVATLALSAPESRFALPVVLIGILGCLTLIPQEGVRLPRTLPSWIWVFCLLVLASALLWVGAVGLSHPAPPGNVSALICRLT